MNEPNHTSRSEYSNGAKTHSMCDVGCARSTMPMNSIVHWVQQYPSIQKHQKRKSDKMKLITFEPNGSCHSVNNTPFENKHLL